MSHSSSRCRSRTGARQKDSPIWNWTPKLTGTSSCKESKIQWACLVNGKAWATWRMPFIIQARFLEIVRRASKGCSRFRLDQTCRGFRQAARKKWVADFKRDWWISWELPGVPISNRKGRYCRVELASWAHKQRRHLTWVTTSIILLTLEEASRSHNWFSGLTGGQGQLADIAKRIQGWSWIWTKGEMPNPGKWRWEYRNTMYRDLWKTFQI